jgi:TusA-related sulfurtransferase
MITKMTTNEALEVLANRKKAASKEYRSLIKKRDSAKIKLRNYETELSILARKLNHLKNIKFQRRVGSRKKRD